MSANIDSIREQLWSQMRGSKPYRDTFVAAHLSTNIAAQIQTLREQRGWTQKQLAENAGMSPARISVIEDPSYETLTLKTLKRLASAFDVAVIARFVPFSDLVDWVANLTPEKLEAAEFEKDSLRNFDAKSESERVAETPVPNLPESRWSFRPAQEQQSLGQMIVGHGKHPQLLQAPASEIKEAKPRPSFLSPSTNEQMQAA